MSTSTTVRPSGPKETPFHRVLVAGAGGRQGLAIAKGLDTMLVRRNIRDVQIVVAEKSSDDAQTAIAKLRKLGVTTELVPLHVEGTSVRLLTKAFRGNDAIVSALHHRYNWNATAAALHAHASYMDLGMDNELTAHQHSAEVSAKMARYGRAMVPDVGLAPGLVNIACSLAVRQTENPKHARIYCGGVPQVPQLPLQYFTTWSIDGLLAEYTLPCLVLRGGQVVEVAALSEAEHIQTPKLRHGISETDHTAGGSSTSPGYYQSLGLEDMEYRTLRAPGHFDFFRQYAASVRRSPHKFLTLPTGEKIRARDLEARLQPKGFPRDVVFFRTMAWNEAGHGYQYEMLTKADPKNELTAMMRATGFTAAAIAFFMANGDLGTGSVALEKVAYENRRFGREFLAAIRYQGLRVKGSKFDRNLPIEAPPEREERPPNLETV